MKRIFKKYSTVATITTLFLVSFFLVSLQGVHAQATGDSIVKCGQTADVSQACKVPEIGQIVKDVLKLVIAIGVPLLFIFVAYRFVTAWFSLQQGNANAYKDAIQKAGQAIFGLLIVVFLIGGGLYAVLTMFGVKPEFLKILNLFSFGGFFPHAYAQTQLPPPIDGTIYDFILNVLRTAMKFFIYPALIVIWVWTGFSFVAAQGAPEALMKAKKWLLWAFITTIVIVVLQAFLLALQASVNKILSKPGQACTTSTGANGQLGTDGVCYAGRGS